MTKIDLIVLIINSVVLLLSSFLGAFLGHRYSIRRRFSDEKKEMYYKLLDVLPVSINISQGDIAREYLSMGSPETSIEILKIRITDYESQLKFDNITTEQQYSLKTQTDNSKYTINQLEHYIVVFNKIMSDFSDFEHSKVFNRFKVYASNDVRKAYLHLNVDIHNDYHAFVKVSSEKLNSLLDRILFNIKCDMYK